jgi:hypothetical protein
MTLSGRLVTYLSRLSNGKLVLWCYLVWYLSTVAHHFDPSPAIWLNSLGISAVIGVALMLSVSGGAARNDPWQAFRLFAMPFCVSSFSSLIKGKGFLLVFPPSSSELAAAIGACLLFAGTVMGLRRWRDAERA